MNLHGCHNRPPLKTKTIVQYGWISTPEGYRIPLDVQILDPMTKDCQYTKSNSDDPKCAGCKWKQEGVK